MEIILIVLVVIIIFWVFLVIKFSKWKKLTSDQKRFITKNYNKIIANDDSKHRIIDFDKLYHKILIELWYKGSFWSILKQNPKVINDINKVWELHKLRNKLVHDFDIVSDKFLSTKALEYQKIIKILIKRCS